MTAETEVTPRDIIANTLAPGPRNTVGEKTANDILAVLDAAGFVVVKKP